MRAVTQRGRALCGAGAHPPVLDVGTSAARVAAQSHTQGVRQGQPRIRLLACSYAAGPAIYPALQLIDNRDAEADRAGCRGLSYTCDSEPYAEVFNMLEVRHACW